MASRRRSPSGEDNSSCSDHCSPSPSPNPLPTYSHPHSNRSQTIIIVVIFSFITICFVLLTYYTILLRQDPHTLRRRLRRRRRRRPPPLDLPVSNPPTHHVWLIRTVGLDAAAIASLPLRKHTVGDPISGAGDCSVCLGEVAEGEDYRVLPKCGHVFHVSCIDTWLRSHVNCPLCRAPVVGEPVEVAEEDGGGSGGEGDRRVVRVRSDLGREREREREMGRLRRSVSMGELRIGFGGVGDCNAESSSAAKSEVEGEWEGEGEGSVPKLEPEGSAGTNGGSFLSRFRGRSGALL